MKDEMNHPPQTRSDFLFWAWDKCKGENIDDTKWDLRFQMMVYHYKKGLSK